jgi:hypothetical protein
MAARKRPFNHLFALILGLMLILGGTLAGSTRAQRPAFITANGYVLQQGSVLPVYRFNPPVVSPSDTTNPLAQRFDAIYNRQDVAEETYLGRPRYSVVN